MCETREKGPMVTDVQSRDFLETYKMSPDHANNIQQPFCSNTRLEFGFCSCSLAIAKLYFICSWPTMQFLQIGWA